MYCHTRMETIYFCVAPPSPPPASQPTTNQPTNQPTHPVCRRAAALTLPAFTQQRRHAIPPCVCFADCCACACASACLCALTTTTTPTVCVALGHLFAMAFSRQTQCGVQAVRRHVVSRDHQVVVNAANVRLSTQLLLENAEVRHHLGGHGYAAGSTNAHTHAHTHARTHVHKAIHPRAHAPIHTYIHPAMDRNELQRQVNGWHG